MISVLISLSFIIAEEGRGWCPWGWCKYVEAHSRHLVESATAPPYPAPYPWRQARTRICSWPYRPIPLPSWLQLAQSYVHAIFHPVHFVLISFAIKCLWCHPWLSPTLHGHGTHVASISLSERAVQPSVPLSRLIQGRIAVKSTWTTFYKNHTAYLFYRPFVASSCPRVLLVRSSRWRTPTDSLTPVKPAALVATLRTS